MLLVTLVVFFPGFLGQWGVGCRSMGFWGRRRGSQGLIVSYGFGCVGVSCGRIWHTMVGC